MHQSLNPITKDCCPVCESENVGEFLRAPDRFHGAPGDLPPFRCQALVGLSGLTIRQRLTRWTVTTAPTTPVPSRQRGKALPIAGATATTLFPIQDKRNIARSGLQFGLLPQHPQRRSVGSCWNRDFRRIREEGRSSSGARVFVGDAMAAPFGANTFDVVTCFHVFERFYEPHKILRRVELAEARGNLLHHRAQHRFRGPEGLRLLLVRP